MGFRYGSQCFFTQQEAQSAAFSGRSSALVATDSASLVAYEFNGSVWKINRYSLSSGSLSLVSSVDTQALVFDSCDPLPSAENLALIYGSGFILPMTVYLVAWVVGKMVSMFDD